MKSRPPRVLVVDDNEDDIELVRLALGRVDSPCVVLAASCIPRLEAALQDEPRRPDPVLLDWKMPDMDAAEVVRRIRREPRTVGLPVVVSSSSDDPTDVRRAYEAGASAYVLKPASLGGYEAFARYIHGFWCKSTLLPP